MKVFLCVIILVLPNGEPRIKTSLVDTCPDQTTVEGFFNAQVAAGEIRGWYGACLETPLEYGAPT